jgi:hypothetical protein
MIIDALRHQKSSAFLFWKKGCVVTDRFSIGSWLPLGDKPQHHLGLNQW